MEAATINTTETKAAPVVRDFETMTCTRCGGSGMFGPLCVYGGRCFKCGGAKRYYTKKGAAARRHFEGLLSVTAVEVKAGDKIRVGVVEFRDGAPVPATVWGRVRTVGRDAAGQVIIESEMLGGSMKGGTHHATHSPEEPIRKAADADRKAIALAAALDFQDTLTKAGTVRKRAAK